MHQNGTIITAKTDDEWFVYKILRVDKDNDLYHARMYGPYAEQPTEFVASESELYAEHVPLAITATSENETVTEIGYEAVREEEMDAYYEFLKRFDFERFIKETDQDMEEVLSLAARYYEQGNEFAEQEKFEEAIEEYSKALDLFPFLFEALDNRGLLYMELAEFEQAIDDFEESLKYEKENFLATASLGECYLIIGDKNRAKEYLEEANKMNPEDELVSKLLEEV
jgi:tetratricopeptide (TPR) repeat protein